MNLKMSKTGKAITVKNDIPSFEDIWINDSKTWIKDSGDGIKEALHKSNENYNPLDDEKV